ncbi:YhbY family RNA-binding protein [Candidatus Woesearchaeota archaeon]|nr:YhbY family RNA-binding protein [Candidatus Woesearchaeota archaeon]
MKETLMLRSKAKTLEPIVRIGKSGLSNSIIGEVNKNLAKRKLIKIKLLKSSLEGKEKGLMARELSEKTDSEIIEIVGNTVVLHKK